MPTRLARLSGNSVSGVTNSGIMEATNGGTLLLNYPVVNTSTVLASGGTVQVAGTLSGGTLTSTGVSALQLLNSGTLSGVTLSPSSTAVVPAGNGPLVANGLTNNGTIYVQGKPGSQGGMLFDGSQTLSGSGSIVLALQGTDTSWTLLQTNDTLTQAAGHTISGAGKFFNATIVNQGLVNANVPGQTLDGSQDTGVTDLRHHGGHQRRDLAAELSGRQHEHGAGLRRHRIGGRHAQRRHADQHRRIGPAV